MCKRLWAWWTWRRQVRARRDEEFRLYRIQMITNDPEDLKAWHELNAENHALGVWDR